MPKTLADIKKSLDCHLGKRLQLNGADDQIRYLWIPRDATQIDYCYGNEAVIIITSPVHALLAGVHAIVNE